MQDFVPLGTGNSRNLKSAVPAGTTWEQALAMLRNGTFPIDIGSVNEAGVSQKGTPLHKATLLSDETETLYPGLPDNPTPDNVFSVIASLFSKTGRLVMGEYVGTGGQPTIVFDSKPLFVVIIHSTSTSYSSTVVDIALVPAFYGDAKKPSSNANSIFSNGYIYILTSTGSITTKDLTFYTGGNPYQVENSVRLSGTNAQTMMSMSGVTYKYFAILEA